ncbi:hypothetical protein [Nostoc sp.]
MQEFEHRGGAELLSGEFFGRSVSIFATSALTACPHSSRNAIARLPMPLV